MKNANRLITSLAILLLGNLVSRAAVEYTVTDLGTLGGSTSSARGINDVGQVTGQASTSENQPSAFLWTPTVPNSTTGTMKNLGMQNGIDSTGMAVNIHGIVTGYALHPGSSIDVQHAFLYDGTVHDLAVSGSFNSYGNGINASGHVSGQMELQQDGGDLPHVNLGFIYNGSLNYFASNGGDCSANGINDSGQTTGWYYSSILSANQHAFIWTPTIPNGTSGTFHDLGTLGGSISEGYGINAQGEVVGDSLTVDTYFHAFMYDGNIHDLGTLGGADSFAYSVNSAGLIVGMSDIQVENEEHAFLYRHDTGMTDLNSLIDPSAGWELQYAFGINSSGEIVGNGLIGGQTHAFLLTPVPEPSSLEIAVLAGSLGLLMRRRFTTGAYTAGRLPLLGTPRTLIVRRSGGSDGVKRPFFLITFRCRFD